MARQRTTFGKMQRERDKQAKQVAKKERREAIASQPAEPRPEPPREADEERLIAAFAQLHEDYEAGRVSLDDFEERRDALRSLLSGTG